MKRNCILVFMLALLIGCTTMPIQNPVCPQEGSWICEKSAELGVEPEHVYGWIYDATAIAVITDVVELNEICNFEKDIADWYNRMYPVSYDTFINEVFFKLSSFSPQKMILIKSILNRNFVAYRSPELISTADDIILRKGHTQFRNDMLCF